MKKNKIMRLASVLLVAVILSVCAISGTFAKYTTSGTATDTARVAKWGVTITGVSDGSNELFKNNYDDTVVSQSDALVAPGTSGTFTKFVVTGTPEVKCETKYTATVTFGGKWVSDSSNTYYCPIVVKVNDVAVDTTGITSTTAYASAIEDAIEKASATYAVGETVKADIKIEWSWAFDAASAGANDAADTYLAGLSGSDVPTITVKVDASINQVD